MYSFADRLPNPRTKFALMYVDSSASGPRAGMGGRTTRVSGFGRMSGYLVVVVVVVVVVVEVLVEVCVVIVSGSSSSSTW